MASLEDEAKKRKERLLSLKRKANSQDQEQHDDHVSEIDRGLKKPSFRSYKPSHEALQEEVMELPRQQDVDVYVSDELKLSHDVSGIESVDLTTLQPKKIDWDLKRDVEKKLQKLERRTQRAIASLIRERLAADKTQFLNAVTQGAQVAATESDED